MIRLQIAPEAEEELSEAAAWYEQRRPGLGIELVAEVDGVLESIARSPLSAPRWRDDRPYRRAVLKRFPFVLFYSFDGDEVFVVAVAHARREPEYWLQRSTRTASED